MADKKSSANLDNMPRLGKFKAGGPGQRFAPSEKPKNMKETILRLLRITVKWRKSMIIAVFLTVFSAAFSLITPYLIGRAVNAFNVQAFSIDDSLLTLVLYMLLLCYAASWLIDTINGVLMTRVTQIMIKYIRHEFFAKMQKIMLNFYDTRSHGDTMSRITNDVDNISNTIAQTFIQLIAAVFSIFCTLAIMLYLNVQLTFVAIISIPLFMVLTKVIASRSQKYFLGQQKALGSLNAKIEESIVGIKLVKAFNQQNEIMKDFAQTNQKLCAYSTKAMIWTGLLMPFMNVINNISFACIASIGGILSVQGKVTVGVVVSFLTYSRQFGQPLNSIASMLSDIQSALAGAERIFEIMDEDEEKPDKPAAEELIKPKGKVEFRNVSFAYDNGKPVLNNINFVVNPGEVVALVGETGAGKTTIVNLLVRFYELDQGTILIDDHDITDITRASLRNCFSVVLQDTNLFSGTIYDNIRYSRPQASDAEVIEAAKLAHADEFISRLPKGYNTIVSGSTDNLSQGQRQLLAIARAILCDAPILILDEATSSVDTKTEKEIQYAMLTLMKDHTSFLIAHRLSTIRDADKILVIGKGEILESGTHDELMKNKGPYHDMVCSQMGYGVNGGF